MIFTSILEKAPGAFGDCHRGRKKTRHPDF